jgi:hypothetical protein
MGPVSKESSSNDAATATAAQKQFRGYSARAGGEKDDNKKGKGGGGPDSKFPDVEASTNLEAEAALRRCLPRVKIGDLTAAFQADSSGDGDGCADAQAFFAIVAGTAGFEDLTASQVRAVTHLFDADGDGTRVDWRQFVKFIKYEPPRVSPGVHLMRKMTLGAGAGAVAGADDDAMAHFRALDPGRTGTVTSLDFGKALAACTGGTGSLKPSDLVAITYLFELDGDFMVYYEPFVEYVTQYQPCRNARRIVQSLAALQTDLLTTRGMQVGG